MIAFFQRIFISLEDSTSSPWLFHFVSNEDSNVDLRKLPVLLNNIEVSKWVLNPNMVNQILRPRNYKYSKKKYFFICFKISRKSWNNISLVVQIKIWHVLPHIFLSFRSVESTVRTCLQSVTDFTSQKLLSLLCSKSVEVTRFIMAVSQLTMLLHLLMTVHSLMSESFLQTTSQVQFSMATSLGSLIFMLQWVAQFIWRNDLFVSHTWSSQSY